MNYPLLVATALPALYLLLRRPLRHRRASRSYTANTNAVTRMALSPRLLYRADAPQMLSQPNTRPPGDALSVVLIR